MPMLHVRFIKCWLLMVTAVAILSGLPPTWALAAEVDDGSKPPDDPMVLIPLVEEPTGPPPPTPWRVAIPLVKPSFREPGGPLSKHRVPIFPASVPAGRQAASLCYDRVSDSAIMFGGMCLGNQWYPHSWYNDVWALDNLSQGQPRWRRLRTRGRAPSPRSFHTAVYDAGTDRMIVFGGYLEPGYYLDGRQHDDKVSICFNDLWVLTNANGIGPNEPGEDGPTWHEVIRQGDPLSPPCRHYHGAGYDPQSGRMIIVGGAESALQAPFADVWTLDAASALEGSAARWRPRPTAAWALEEAGPLPRARFAYAYDARADTFFLYGGTGATLMFSDVWRLRDAVRGEPIAVWEPVVPVNRLDAPSPRRALAGAYDAAGGRFFVFGGYDGLQSFNTTCVLEGADGRAPATWRTLMTHHPQGLPEPRRNLLLLWARDTLALVAGTGGYESVDYNDVWRLTAESLASPIIVTPPTTPKVEPAP
jgi:hypothetical protein